MLGQVFDELFSSRDLCKAYRQERRQMLRNLARRTSATLMPYPSADYFVTTCRLLTPPWVQYICSYFEKSYTQ